MSIPMSALRRALLSALDRPGVQRVLPAPILGAGAGGAFGAAASALDGDISDAGEYAMTGATIGAGLGGIGVGAAVNRSLREALAEQAASRGVGRRAVREAADAGDAAAFAQASRGASLDIDQLTSEVARRAALSRNDPAALDEVMRAVEERYGRDVAEEVARRISL